MNIEQFRAYCMGKKGVTEETPFGPDILVFKVMGKMFALADIAAFESINLKCNPELAIDLREQYAAVKPGYHMSKKHWNTIQMDASISDPLLEEWIDLSYQLVIKGLPKAPRQQLDE